MARLSVEQQLDLWNKLEELQEAFPYTEEGFLLFSQVIISTLITGNPDLNRIQADICKYLFSGPTYRMIQAQRGQAKTTLTAIFAVFLLIHFPHYRIAVFSQNGKRAKEISGYVVKIFLTMDFLSFMLPDTSNGDRSSVEAFDVHWALKGMDKSPSVACQSVESGLAGMRADVIIADDIESLENSRTVGGRELTEERCAEFESINSDGDIIYLGTPQSIESIYNNLPAKGYDIRIWPGRYPNASEMDAYGPYLAPIILQDISDDPSIQTGFGPTGTSGKPTCPEMFDDEALIIKEIAGGSAKFQLQRMLNTRLSDDARFPLKISDLIVHSIGSVEGPVMPIWASGPRQIATQLPRFGNKQTDRFNKPIEREYDWAKYDRTVMYIDPAGGGKNGDEIAYAIIKLIGTFIYIAASGGVPGGYDEGTLLKLVDKARDHNCKMVYIEKNYGHGAHYAMLKPLFEKNWPVDLEEVYEAGQKELRIIDVIEPVLSSHRLVITPEVIHSDLDSIGVYPTEVRMSYSLLFQLSNITRDKDCLRHDDRLDALAGAIRQVVQSIDYDMTGHLLRQQAREQKEYIRIWSDPAIRRKELYSYEEPSSGSNRFSSRGSTVKRGSRNNLSRMLRR